MCACVSRKSDVMSDVPMSDVWKEKLCLCVCCDKERVHVRASVSVRGAWGLGRVHRPVCWFVVSALDS